jgi:hypothetical protein
LCKQIGFPDATIISDDSSNDSDEQPPKKQRLSPLLSDELRQSSNTPEFPIPSFIDPVENMQTFNEMEIVLNIDIGNNKSTQTSIFDTLENGIRIFSISELHNNISVILPKILAMIDLLTQLYMSKLHTRDNNKQKQNYRVIQKLSDLYFACRILNEYPDIDPIKEQPLQPADWLTHHIHVSMCQSYDNACRQLQRILNPRDYEKMIMTLRRCLNL